MKKGATGTQHGRPTLCAEKNNKLLFQTTTEILACLLLYLWALVKKEVRHELEEVIYF